MAAASRLSYLARADATHHFVHRARDSIYISDNTVRARRPLCHVWSDSGAPEPLETKNTAQGRCWDLFHGVLDDGLRA